MTEEQRLADERDKALAQFAKTHSGDYNALHGSICACLCNVLQARRRLEDETRLRNEELHRKADSVPQTN